MTFRLATLLYLFALVAASLAVFGPWGLLFAGTLIFLGLAGIHNNVKRSDLPVGCLQIVGVIGFIVFATFSLVPTVNSPPRGWNQISQSHNAIRQIEHALIAYETAHGHYPPAVVRSDQGEPLYSWRVELLPYIDQQPLYDQLHLDEPWDSPHNTKVLSKADVSLFQSTRVYDKESRPHETNFVAIVGQDTAWPADGTLAFNDVKPVAGSTINLMEVGGLGIHWAEPRDVTLEQAIDLMTGNAANQVEFERKEVSYFSTTKFALKSRVVAIMDGRVNLLHPLEKREDAKALLTIAGHEKPTVEPSTLDSKGSLHRLGTIVHWDHVVGVVLLVVIVLLPAVPTVRRRVLPTVKPREEDAV